ncbi:hypothetical protein [Arthrobacter sp.]|uniref:hypothetical protein n=1 Tax=Arthrobacter sp. TaxID=1667 RepID=UPI0026E093AB|nr:hypothetical protein [Arthrobacter sp.]MDO5752491.1 hypothetical protein [Arthrobacter sp.]
MTTQKKSAKKLSLPLFAGVTLMMLGLSLAGCSTNDPAPAANSTSTVDATQGAAVPVMDPATPAAATAAPASQEAPAERKVTLHVEGAKSDALVKALVVTADGKESGGEMKTEQLPFNQELTLPADSTFTKILVLGKYASGATGEISCSISIDGKEVAAQKSDNHKPAECLFVEKGSN